MKTSVGTLGKMHLVCDNQVEWAQLKSHMVGISYMIIIMYRTSFGSVPSCLVMCIIIIIYDVPTSHIWFPSMRYLRIGA